MTATADQIARTEAKWTDFELRFFVGADRALTDLSTLAVGQNYDPDNTTTLSADIDFSDDSIPVVSTSGFDKGFIVIHPYAAGESYELVVYESTTSTTFDDITRFYRDTEGSMHSSGATVSEWREVTENILGDISLNITQSDEIGDWSVDLAGIGYDSTLFQPGRAFLAMVRYRPNAGSMSSWTDWGIMFIGYLQDIAVTGTWKQDNPWTAKVESLAYYAKNGEVGSGVNYGLEEIASGKTVTVSSYLTEVYQEEDSGEFLGTPDLNGDKLVDDDMSTLWISDGEPAPTVETAMASVGCVNEVYVRSEPWMPDDLQWIEIHHNPGDPNGIWMDRLAVCTSTTVWKETNWDPVGWVPANNHLGLGGLRLTPVGDDGDSFIIITNNKPAFMAYFPQCQVNVVDWRAHERGTFTLNPEGDLIALRWNGVDTYGVVWYDNGRADWALYDFVGAGSYYYALNGTNYSGWTGDMLTLPPVGHSFRRSPTGQKSSPGRATDWKQDEDHPTPGFFISGEPEWAYVDLGTLGITLSAQLTAGYDVEATFGDSGTLGLKDGPAYVLIDTEGIRYESIDRINNKIVDLTRAIIGSDVTHPAGSTVKQYEDGAGTENHLVTSVMWRRRPIMTTVYDPLIQKAWNVPKHFDVYISIYDSGFPLPTDEEWNDGIGSGGWEDWWDRIASVRNYGQTMWQITNLEALRARVVMIACMGMVDGGRVKLNEFNIFGPYGTISTDGTVDGDWETGYSGEIVSDILQTWLSVPEANIDLLCDGMQVYTMDVVRGKLSAALADICSSSGTVVRFLLDNTVEYDWDPLYPLGSWPSVHFAWGRDSAREIRYNMVAKNRVAQVILNVTAKAIEESFTVAFPMEALPLGEVLELNEDLLITTEDDARVFAEAIYRKESMADTVTIVPVGIAEWVYPGQRHTVDFELDDAGTFLTGQNVVVTDVSHTINMGDEHGEGKLWNTEIQARRVEYA